MNNVFEWGSKSVKDKSALITNTSSYMELGEIKQNQVMCFLKKSDIYPKTFSLSF